jgi:hypothetical protein
MGPTVTAAVQQNASLYGGPGAEKPGPDTPSADYKTMSPLWEKVATLARGEDAVRAAAKRYIPQFSDEDDGDYKDRIAQSPFTNIYDDIASGLASKPFSREVQYEDPDDVDQRFLDLYENVDGRGNNLHVFSEVLFREGLDNAIDWILVDFTRLPPLSPGASRSIAQEESLGARPYWVRVAAANVKAVYSDMVRGQEVLTHVRFYEPAVERDGYGEGVKERYRIFERQPVSTEDGDTEYEPATWRVEEKQTDSTGKVTWNEIDSGPVDIGVIPMVPFMVGKRIGNGWAVQAPLAKLIDMQIDCFKQESNMRNIELLTCFPMLTANGVAQPMLAPGPDSPVGAMPRPAKIKVGPRAVLFAPVMGAGGSPGSWNFIEPTSQSIDGLYERLTGKWDRMREIGLQPLAEASITVITSANISVKAKSALQAWTLRLKDTLEQAMVITGLWWKMSKDEVPGVDVYKDFGVDQQSDAAVTALNTANANKSLSGETLRAEFKRRGILSDNYDEDEEQKRLAEEAAAAAEQAGGGQGEEDVDPVTGKPLDPANDDEGGDGTDDGLDPEGITDPSQIDDNTLAKFFGARAAGGGE